MAVIDINPSGPLTVSKIKKMVWNPDKKNVISITYHINETNVDSTNYIPCTYLDGNSITSIKLQGSMWINNSGDINGLAKGIPPLAIGTEGKEHLEIDYNEIAAKSDDVTPSHLYFNMEGGGVSVNNNCDRAVMFKDGAIYAKNESFNDGKWIGIVDGLNEAGNTTFGYGGYLNNIGSTNIYGKDINLTSKGDVVANTSFIVPNGSSFQGTNTSGAIRNNFQPCNTNNNCVVGYGSYTAAEGSTNIYGNRIELRSNNEISFVCTNLILNGNEVALSDSGWKTPTIVSTMQSFDGNSANAIKYRKVGKIVDIAGAVSPKATGTLANGSDVTLFTLPSGYRPAYTRTFVGQGSGRNVFMIQVNSAGGVVVSRYRNTTSTTDAYPTSVPTTAWLPISVTFTVN